MEWGDAESATLSAKLVAVDGHQLRLKGDERALAIRIMTARGISADEMAERLCIKTLTLYGITKKLGIKLPKKKVAHWSIAYMDREYNARRQRNKGRDVRTSTKETEDCEQSG